MRSETDVFTMFLNSGSSLWLIGTEACTGLTPNLERANRPSFNSPKQLAHKDQYRPCLPKTGGKEWKRQGHAPRCSWMGSFLNHALMSNSESFVGRISIPNRFVSRFAENGAACSSSQATTVPGSSSCRITWSSTAEMACMERSEAQAQRSEVAADGSGTSISDFEDL